MKNKILEKFIRDIVQVYLDQDKFVDTIHDAIGIETESKLFNALHYPIEIMIAYVDSEISHKAGCETDWFSYFIYECGCGGDEWVVTTHDGEKKYVFDSVDSFIKFLEDEYSV